MALQLARKDLHRKPDLPGHRGMRNLGGRDQGHRRRPQAVQEAAQARGHRGGHRPAHRDQDQAHLQVRLLQGRRGNPRPREAHRRDREEPAESNQIHDQVVRGPRARNTARAANGEPRSSSFERVDRQQVVAATETLYRGREERIRRIRIEEGREAVGQMFHHRRHHRLLPGREDAGDEGGGKGLRRTTARCALRCSARTRT